MPEDHSTQVLGKQPPLDARVSYRISRLNARLNAQATRILNDCAQISLSQWQVMVVIEREGAVTASEIVRKTKIDKALISRTIKGLVDQGLIRSDVSETDSRAHSLRFTSKGIRAFEEALPQMLARHSRLIRDIDDTELDQFFNTLTKIEDALDCMEPDK